MMAIGHSRLSRNTTIRDEPEDAQMKEDFLWQLIMLLIFLVGTPCLVALHQQGQQAKALPEKRPGLQTSDTETLKRAKWIHICPDGSCLVQPDPIPLPVERLASRLTQVLGSPPAPVVLAYGTDTPIRAFHACLMAVGSVSQEPPHLILSDSTETEGSHP